MPNLFRIYFKVRRNTVDDYQVHGKTQKVSKSCLVSKLLKGPWLWVIVSEDPEPKDAFSIIGPVGKGPESPGTIIQKKRVMITIHVPRITHPKVLLFINPTAPKMKIDEIPSRLDKLFSSLNSTLTRSVTTYVRGKPLKIEGRAFIILSAARR